MKKFLLICLCLNSSFIYAYVDLNLSYTLSQRNIDGAESSVDPDPGSAKTTSVGYTVNWAWYIWRYTALEFNYSQTNERLKDNRRSETSDASAIVTKVDSNVITQVAGIGLRQSFAKRKAAVQPSLSAGFARYTTSGEREIVFDVAGVEQRINTKNDPQVFGSGYLGLAVRFRLTELMGLTFSARSVMPDFDFAQAADNVTYSAGFSWIF